MKTGSCLCGSVAFEINGPMADAHACHCTQCRKQTGNYWVSSHVADADLKFIRQDGLGWYASSDYAKRGFCKDCGSNLFWKKNDSHSTSICLGSIDGQTGVRVEGHIYCADSGDYYEISGGDFQKPQW